MTEAGWLAATKLIPPVLPARHIVRGELIRALVAAASSTPAPKVILVSAPAGSGKTTLLAALADPALRAAASAPEPPELAWLQLEAADRDPTRFWVAIAHAVDRVRPGLAAEVSAVVRATRGSPDAAVSILVNQLAGGASLVVVLDDYHVVDSDEIAPGWTSSSSCSRSRSRSPSQRGSIPGCA